ncbi:MAG: YgeY family selenium metabolism-linked hydrolase [Spirochaetes bacterium]|nr:YgeY family selenium metabolism-linked hydrolase [Spirochaetota bacterium]
MNTKDLIQEKIKAAGKLIDKNMPEVLKFLSDMIKIPSLSGNETNIVSRIKKEMVKCLFDEIYIDRIGNVIGRIGQGEKIILMESHIDVLDVYATKLWNTEPFRGVVKNNYVYGRGSVDQKGAFAAILYSAYILKKLKLFGNVSLFIAGTVMFEKCPGVGLEHLLVNEQLKPQCVLITAPTNGNIHIAQKGHLQIKLSVYGEASHSGLGPSHKNAIATSFKVIKEIKKLDRNLKTDKITGKNKIAITGIVTKNPDDYTIPSLCEIYLDIQTSPKEVLNALVSKIKKFFKKFGNIEVELERFQGHSYKEYMIDYEKYLPGWTIEKKSKLIRTAVKSYNMVYNKNPKLDFWEIPTSGSISMGKLKIPTFGFGPGLVKDTHTENEAISVSQIKKSMLFYVVFPYVFSEFEHLF